jgi:hypothetical protein
MKYTIKHGRLAAICNVDSELGNCQLIYVSDADPLNDTHSNIKVKTLPKQVQDFVKQQFDDVFNVELFDRGDYIKKLPITEIEV